MLEVCTVLHLQPKVGGTFKMSFRNFKTGQSHSFGGEYVELVPNERLRYTDKFDDPNLAGDIQVTVMLKKVSVGTEVNIVQEGLPDVIPLEACYLGWQELVAKLGKARRARNQSIADRQPSHCRSEEEAWGSSALTSTPRQYGIDTWLLTCTASQVAPLSVLEKISRGVMVNNVFGGPTVMTRFMDVRISDTAGDDLPRLAAVLAGIAALCSRTKSVCRSGLIANPSKPWLFCRPETGFPTS